MANCMGCAGQVGMDAGTVYCARPGEGRADACITLRVWRAVNDAEQPAAWRTALAAMATPTWLEQHRGDVLTALTR